MLQTLRGLSAEERAMVVRFNREMLELVAEVDPGQAGREPPCHSA